MKRFSIIVPIYNVEKYLRACIDSVLTQTFRDYELILVDDGSPDKSGEICDEYALRDDRIKVIHKENGGLSDARNVGISIAEGEYLLFIDSDDFYDDEKFFEKLDELIVIKQPDIVVYSMKHFHNGNSYYVPSKVTYIDAKWNAFDSYEQTLCELLKENKFVISACSHAVKRELILERQLFFKKGIVSEDIEWAMRLYAKEMKLSFLKKQPYIYRAGREGSITNTMKEKNFNDLLGIIEEYANKFLENKTSVENLLLNYLAYQYVILCGLIVRATDRKFKRSFIKKLIKFKWILKYDLCYKVKKAKKVYSLLGIRAMISVLGLYIKFGR